MTQPPVFQILTKQSARQLLECLELIWQRMDAEQREQFFDPLISEMSGQPVSAEDTLKEVEQFRESSFGAEYYAPVDPYSKEYRGTPEETCRWFARLDELFKQCTQLTRQKDYQAAVEGFTVLYELVDDINHREIIFIDRIGMWMFSDDKRAYFAAYFEALSAVSIPKVFAKTVLPYLAEDDRHHLMDDLYAAVQNAATEEQMVLVDQLVKDKGIRIGKNDWQTNELQAAVCEANAGDFASDQEVKDTLSRWETASSSETDNTEPS